MSGTTTKSHETGVANSDVRDVVIQHNKVITDGDQMDLIVRNRMSMFPGCAIATTTTKVKTANDVAYSIDGRMLLKTATDNLWTLSGATVADGSSNKYLLCIDASGTASIVEGTQAATLAAVTLPALPTSKSVFCTLSVSTSGATFVPGTTALNAGTVTVVYRDGLDSGYFTTTAAKIGNQAGTAITA